jgi:F0F1-type ATP synthase alpha subunit
MKRISLNKVMAKLAEEQKIELADLSRLESMLNMQRKLTAKAQEEWRNLGRIAEDARRAQMDLQEVHKKVITIYNALGGAEKVAKMLMSYEKQLKKAEKDLGTNIPEAIDIQGSYAIVDEAMQMAEKLDKMLIESKKYLK